MTITYLGELTLGDAVPGAAAVGVAGAAGITGALPNLQDQLARLLAFTPTPVSFTEQITGLNLMLQGLQASISLGLVPPPLDTQLAALATMIATLQAQVSALGVQLSVITTFQSLLGAAGIHALAYAGTVGAFGSQLDAANMQVPGLGAGDAANALVLLTTVPATWAALAQILKVSP